MPTAVVKPFYQDPFTPTLFNSPALAVTTEQTGYIKKVLDKACSDSRFAEKAYIAILLILTKGNTAAPVVTSLTPNSAEIGDPAFTLHVHGTGFKSGDKIIFAGVEEPTVFVSATELTTGVNMPLWVSPDAIPVMVQSAEGILSSPPMTFTFVDNVPVALTASHTPTHTSVPVHTANKPTEVKK